MEGAAVRCADNIAAALAKADPENASNYTTNKTKFVSKVRKLDVEIIEMDNQELFKKVDNKTTFAEAFRIHYKRMKECIGF